MDAAIERPRLNDGLSVAAGSRRLILVEAPAGYGKSTILSDWVRNTPMPSAWLTLDRFDAQPERLFRGILAAIQSAAARDFPAMNEVLLSHDRALVQDEAASYDHLLGALELLDQPLAVVIDDVHLAGPGLVDGIVGVLTRSAPPSLKLVLSGRDHSSLRLERLRYSGGLEEFRTGDLAFTLEEAARFADGLGRAPGWDVEEIWAATAGWPVAIHAAFLGVRQAQTEPEGASGVFTSESAFADYIAEEVLSQLDEPLADFVLRATTCDWLERGLAIELSGLPTAGILLQECLRKGLFLEETDFREDEAVYHWQPLFAAQCRGILEYRNPVLAEHLHRVAARYYEDVDVSESVAQALMGREPQLAAEALGGRWVEYLLRNGLHALEQLCLDLAAPWCDDAEVLLIRAVCRSLAGDVSSAAVLNRRALAGVADIDAGRRQRLESFADLLGLLPRDSVTAAGHAAAVQNDDGGHAGEPTTEVALLRRTDIHGRDGSPLANTVAGTVRGIDASVEERVGVASEIALAHAAAGDLMGADKIALYALESAQDLGWSADGPGDSAWLARGIACYWVDDLVSARSHLDKIQHAGNGVTSAAKLCAFYRVLIDCAGGDEVQVAASRSQLASPQNRGLFGPSWQTFSVMARAKLAEASGDLAGALAMVKPLGVGGHPPLVETFLAELLRRGGNFADALRCTESLPERQRNAYIGTSMALTESLIAAKSGDMTTAHERIEHAISLAEPQCVLRPFAERHDDLSGLLVQHAVWGTAHEAFVAARMTPSTHDDSMTTFLYWSLTERELEVLTYMRSMMTAADIGSALFISVNTVKTHQRSIYRKLGAASRRDVLKIAAARGIL
ncbi:LuxR C-terminal-related transcriptional regulator [Paenarthrobacter sp. NPDC056912]|uniref:helix-turn-helix transcriptional regulator n=1 Tax=Paenarthrobacter sp. NPDC056912 TaxID=3345965 RepID=UPI00367108DF